MKKIAIIKVREYGEMVFELFENEAPITVGNFEEYANKNFYDGLGFCRIVKDFVIQGGSPDNNIMTDSEHHIKGEFIENGVDNKLIHKRGAISMARDDDYNTAGTQFFIVHKKAERLDKKYAAFGYMIEGFEVLDKIAEIKTLSKEEWNYPLSLPIIESIRVTDEV